MTGPVGAADRPGTIARYLPTSPRPAAVVGLLSGISYTALIDPTEIVAVGAFGRTRSPHLE